MSRATLKPILTHKPKRDSQNQKELADLKRENHHLRRKVSQLRKRVDQLEAFIDPDYAEILTEPMPEASPDAPAAPPPPECVCPDCGNGELIRVETPTGKVLMGCRRCQWRNAA